MTIKNTICKALEENDKVIVLGPNQGKILEAAEKISGGIGKTLSTGAVSYTVDGKKKVYVGNMPSHPSLLDAARITV